MLIVVKHFVARLTLGYYFNLLCLLAVDWWDCVELDFSSKFYQLLPILAQKFPYKARPVVMFPNFCLTRKFKVMEVSVPGVPYYDLLHN